MITVEVSNDQSSALKHKSRRLCLLSENGTDFGSRKFDVSQASQFLIATHDKVASGEIPVNVGWHQKLSSFKFTFWW